MLEKLALLPMNKRLTKISKYLTFILRHEPHAIGLTPDSEGYVPVDELIQNANASGKTITAEQVQQVVAGHDPPLFAFSDNEDRIRIVAPPSQPTGRSSRTTRRPAQPTGRPAQSTGSSRKRSPWDRQR